MIECWHINGEGPLVELKKRAYADGTIHYCYQCNRCGITLPPIPHSVALFHLKGKEASAFNEALREEFRNGPKKQTTLF